MNKYKYLIKNVGLIGVSQFSSKALTFILVPLYTHVLSTAEYGTYDIYNTFISLLLPILTLNIFDAVLRFCLDEGAEVKIIISTSFKIINRGILILVALIIILLLLNIIPSFNEYAVPFLFLYIATALTNLFSNVARGLDEVRIMAIAGILSTFSMLVLNILFLLVFKFGLQGYFWANTLGMMIGNIYSLIALRIWRYIGFKYDQNASKMRNSMVKYSSPMILNSLGWWINIASLRYAVLFFLGVAANGIFSVAYKIPNIINIASTIFNSAWTMSSAKSFDKNDQDGFFRRTYHFYSLLMVFSACLVIMFTKPLAMLLYAKEFYEAWRLVPFITISAVFSAISGYLGGIFSAVKSTKEFATSTLVSAVINIVLGIALTWQFGLIGTSIAVTVSSYSLWIIRVHQVKRYINMDVNLLRDHVIYLILLVQSILIIMCPTYIGLGVSALILLLILSIYYKEIVLFMKTLRRKVRTKSITKHRKEPSLRKENSEGVDMLLEDDVKLDEQEDVENEEKL